jgi:hypothetical protein
MTDKKSKGKSKSKSKGKSKDKSKGKSEGHQPRLRVVAWDPCYCFGTCVRLSFPRARCGRKFEWREWR